jgi:hypothetical protein
MPVISVRVQCDAWSSCVQVPFALMATAYRRKRMMEGLLSGDKEVKQQMVQMADERQQQQQQATAQLTRVPSVTSLSSKVSPTQANAASDVVPDSSRSNSLDAPHLLPRTGNAARLQQVPGEFFGLIKQRVGLRRSGPDSLILPYTNEELKALDPENSNAIGGRSLPSLLAAAGV